MIERAQRRLAAIVSVDVVGYSRLMGVDETGTLAALRAHRAEMIDATIAEYGGRIVKTMGDGLLLEFPSVVDAAQCVIEIQSRMSERNQNVAADLQITFRIGLNLGDIIIDGDDILGDGVNVAARLQEIAEPGGVAVSQRVHDDIRDRLDVNFANGGELALKNIARPVQIWRWAPNYSPTFSLPQSDQADSGSLLLELPDKPSVAVLPFDNMSRDPEQEFFADGMAEDIITALSQFEWLFVIARNSSFTFKGRAVNVTEVSEALGVRYVIEGSVRTAGNKVRITAQLIDALSGNHIWARRYDRELEDIFAVQDEITEAIVGAIAPEIDEAERRIVQQKPPESLDIWGRYQQALAGYYLSTSEGYEAAIRQFDKINELAPSFALAFAKGADARYRYALHFGGDDRPKIHQEAATKAQIAIALNSLNPECMISLARMYSYQGLHDIAIAKVAEAIARNPNSAMAIFNLGYFCFRARRFEEAIPHVERAIRLSPRDASSFGFYAVRTFSAFCLGRYEEAADWALRTSSAPNPRPRFSYWVVTTLAKAGRRDEAIALMQELQRRNPEVTLSTYLKHLHSNLSEVSNSFDIVIEALRDVGMPE